MKEGYGKKLNVREGQIHYPTARLVYHVLE